MVVAVVTSWLVELLGAEIGWAFASANGDARKPLLVTARWAATCREAVALARPALLRERAERGRIMSFALVRLQRSAQRLFDSYARVVLHTGAIVFHNWANYGRPLDEVSKHWVRLALRLLDLINAALPGAFQRARALRIELDDLAALRDSDLVSEGLRGEEFERAPALHLELGGAMVEAGRRAFPRELLSAVAIELQEIWADFCENWRQCRVQV